MNRVASKCCSTQNGMGSNSKGKEGMSRQRKTASRHRLQSHHHDTDFPSSVVCLIVNHGNSNRSMGKDVDAISFFKCFTRAPLLRRKTVPSRSHEPRIHPTFPS